MAELESDEQPHHRKQNWQTIARRKSPEAD